MRAVLQIEVRWSAKSVDKPPNGKRAKLSLTRFSTPRSDEEMMEIYKGKRSANTQRSTAWAVKVFRECISECNSKYPEDQVPEDFLDQNFTERSTPLNHWLSRFVVEARRQDGENHPPALHSLLAGILRYMREQNPDTPDFLSKKDWILYCTCFSWLPVWQYDQLLAYY